MNDQITEWLLKGDPAVKWQVQRDLLELPDTVYEQTRASMREEGWARKIMDHQNSQQTWEGLYGPKFVSPFYNLLLLKRLGYPQDSPELHPALKSILPNKKMDDGGISYGWKHSEACVTGMFLAITGYFRFENEFIDELSQYASLRQMEDGGWNCRHPRVKTSHSSFNTTYSMLEGLLELSRWKEIDVSHLTEPAHEFFLNHKLYQSHRTGRQVHHDFAITTFPQRWKYNFLGGLDYFREIEHGYDERFEDAISLLHKREKDGKWGKGKPLGGRRIIKLEKERGVSKFNTMRALRVLKWFDRISD